MPAPARATRTLALAPLLAALALAGCITSSETLQPAALGVPPVVPAFLPAVAMDQPTGGAEPNIAALADGTLFIAAVAGSQERPNALEGASWLWRSADGGATWETLRSPVRETPLGSVPMTRKPFGSSDADVVTSPDGWVYYTDWWNWGAPVVGTPRYGSYMVERSPDGGATWDRVPITTLDSVGGIDRQWLVAGEDGFLGLFYAYFHGPQNRLRAALDPFSRQDYIMSIQAVFSRDHGATWGNPVTVVQPIPGRSYQIAHPFILPDGTLVMPFGDTVEIGTDYWRSPSAVRVAVSRDGGASWAPRLVAAVPEGFDNLWAVQGAADATGLGADARGHLYVAWAARTGATMTVFLSRSPDDGTTWSAPMALRSEGLNFLPWVAARGDGVVAVGWYGGDVTGDPLEAPEDAAWHAWVAESRDGGHTFAAAKASEEPVKLGPMCPRGAACPSDRELLDYVSVVYAPDGKLHLAFAKSRDVGGAKAGLVHAAVQAVAAP